MANRLRDLQQLATRLDEQDPDPEARLQDGTVGSVLTEILFHAEARYWQFTPTHYRSLRFEDRLWEWLTNATITDEDRIALLRSVPFLQFVDRDDMLALYRAAFVGPITRWLMDQLALDYSLPGLELRARLKAATDETWFCPVTDSMDISQFHHVNDLAGKKQRPCWTTLKAFGEVAKIVKYMDKENVKRIVLLEDFVGSGVQTSGPVRFAATKLGAAIPVLFVPLIVSAFGLEALRDALGSVQDLSIEPVFVLPKHAHVRQDPQAAEPAMFAALRRIALGTFEVVKQARPPARTPLAEPLGFRSSGALIVLHTNCPNNTVPLYWHDAPEWRALFPRVSRDEV